MKTPIDINELDNTFDELDALDTETRDIEFAMEVETELNQLEGYNSYEC